MLAVERSASTTMASTNWSPFQSPHAAICPLIWSRPRLPALMSPSYLKRFSPIPKRASAPVEVASRRRADAHAVLSFLLPIDRRARERLATALEHSAWHASAMAVRNSPKRILCCPLCLRRLAARSLYGTSLGAHGVGYVASTGASQASGSAHWRSEMESGWRIF